MNNFCLVIIKDQLIVSSPCSNVPDARVKPVSRDLLTDRVIVIEEGIYLRVIGVYHSVQLVCIDDVLDRRGVSIYNS